MPDTEPTAIDHATGHVFVTHDSLMPPFELKSAKLTGEFADEPEQPRRSIQPTYDSRVTGPRYTISTTVNGEVIDYERPLTDPFVRHTVHIDPRDLLRWLPRLLWRRQPLDVVVRVSGDSAIIQDVIELDANYNGSYRSTRSTERAALKGLTGCAE